MVYLLLLTVFLGGLVHSEDSLWTQLPAIEALCPGQNVCPEARPLNVSDAGPTFDIDDCCSECSCDPSCIFQGNCCFQRMDTIRDRSDQECFYETFFPPTETEAAIKSYYMVAKEPKNGCVANFKLNSVSNKSCCEAEVAPWGSFLPVWSPSKARIYKNRVYAECHDAYDFILWDASQICNEVKECDSDLDGCNIHFTFPGRKEVIQTEQCFTNFYGSCPDDFELRPGVQNLTKQEIRDGCQSDFRLTYGALDHLKNVYCYICMKSPYQMPKRQCNTLAGNRTPFGKNKLTSLLSREYLAEYRPNRSKVPDKACEMAEGKMLVERCRQVYCPTGRTFSAVDGNCLFASQSWNIGDLIVWILLTFDDPNDTLTYDAVRDLVKSGLHIIFPKKWVIAYAFIPIFDSVSLTADWRDNFLKTIHQNTLQKPAKELLLAVYPRDNTGEPSELMETFQSNLLEQWTVRCGDILIKTSARLNVPLNFLGISNDIGRIFIPSFMQAMNNNGSMVFKESNAFLMVEIGSKLKPSIDVISKLFFCWQVELQSHEFVLYSDTNPLALFLVKGDKYLGLSEFRLRKTGGNTTARVCLQDAGYYLNQQTATARRLQAPAVIICMVLLATSFRYFIEQ